VLGIEDTETLGALFVHMQTRVQVPRVLHVQMRAQVPRVLGMTFFIIEKYAGKKQGLSTVF
jgi:hypothetical protein